MITLEDLYDDMVIASDDKEKGLKDALADHLAALNELKNELNDKVIEFQNSALKAKALFDDLFVTLDDYERS